MGRGLLPPVYSAEIPRRDRTRVLRTTRRYLKPGHRIFIGVVSPIDSLIENPKKIRDRILAATRYIYRWNNLEPPMTVVFRHSGTTLRPRGKMRLRRFGRGWKERCLRKKLSMTDRAEFEDEKAQLGPPSWRQRPAFFKSGSVPSRRFVGRMKSSNGARESLPRR